MNPRPTAIKRLSRGDEEYSRDPRSLAAGLAFALLVSGAILFGLSLTQRAAKEPAPEAWEDLRAVAISPPPPPPDAQTEAATTENAPSSLDLTLGAVESALPDAVRIPVAALPEIAVPSAKMGIDLAPGAFKPKGGLGERETRRVYEKSEVDQAVVALRKVAPSIHPDMLRKSKVRHVLLLFVVGADGLPGEFRVLQSVNPTVDALVIEAVQQWSFRPARKNKKAVQQWVQLPIVFREGSGNPFRLE
jgi:TonB family protein